MKNSIFKGILIVVFSTLIGIIIGSGCFMLTSAIKNKKILEENLFYENLISKVNNINLSFNDETLNDDDVKENEIGSICRLYKSENDSDIIKDLKEVYVNPFKNDFYFTLYSYEEDSKDSLYVCLPEGCKIQEINSYKVEKTDDGVLAYLKAGNSELGVLLDDIDGKKKFRNPIMICDYSSISSNKNN